MTDRSGLMEIASEQFWDAAVRDSNNQQRINTMNYPPANQNPETKKLSALENIEEELMRAVHKAGGISDDLDKLHDRFFGPSAGELTDGDSSADGQVSGAIYRVNRLLSKLHTKLDAISSVKDRLGEIA